MRFRDRREAGRRLADRLAPLRSDRPVVVALPRGGVAVAAEVASALQAPLDVLVVRKLGHPGEPELGVGAIAEGGVSVVNRELMAHLGISAVALEQVAEVERTELERRVDRYRGGHPRVPVAGRTVVLVDDGLATGFTARAAIDGLRRAGAGTVWLAVPVAPADTLAELRSIADAVVCLQTPDRFRAIGEWYDDFSQVSDAEVTGLLATACGAVTDRSPQSGCGTFGPPENQGPAG